MAKRGLCLLLALATVFSLAAPAFAEEGALETAAQTEETATTEEPVEVPEEPVEVPEEPVEAPEEPVEVPEEPVEVPEEPVEVPEEPVEVPEEPVEVPEEPVEATEEPVEVPEEPVEATEEPVEATEAPEGPAGDAALALEPDYGVLQPPTITSGTVGSLSWSLDVDSKTLTISGSGALPDKNNSNLDLYKNAWCYVSNGPDYVQYLVLEPGVTAIGAAVFSECQYLKSIQFPASLTSIGTNAFSGCKSLTSVTIPETVASIGQYAFANCDELTEVTILNPQCELVPYQDFSNAVVKGYTGSTVEDYYNDYKGFTFEPLGLMGLEGSCGPQGNEDAIRWKATEEGDLEFFGAGPMADFPSEADVPWRAVAPYIKSVFIDPGITSIGDYAFADFASLNIVSIPDSVTKIGRSAFSHSGLPSVTISDSVTQIGSSAFCNCGLTAVSIPASVTDLGDYAFEDCGSLKSVELFVDPGYSAFSGCTALTDVTFSGAVTDIGTHAFYECASLATVTLPESVTHIGDDAFYGCKNLTSLTVPAMKCAIDSMGSLGDYTVTVVSGYEFSDVKAFIENNTVNGTGRFQFKSLGMHAMSGVCGFQGNENSVTWSLTPEGVLTIAGSGPVEETLGYAPWMPYKDYIAKVVVGEGVTSVSMWAFKDCAKLTDVTIPGSVAEISEAAFYGCTGLKNVTIASGVKTIGEGAFNGCSSLNGLTIPGTVTGIEYAAFKNCASLQSVDVPDSVHSIKNEAFSGCGSLTSITIRDRDCEIENSATTLGVSATTTISGYTNSTAQTYAQANGYGFKALDGSGSETTPGGSGSETTPGGSGSETTPGGSGSETTPGGSGSGTTEDVKPAKPAKPTVKNTATGITISWKAVEGAAKYRIYYKTTGSWKKLKDVTGDTSYTWTKAKSGTKYAFTVCAYSAGGKASGYDKTGKSITFVAAPKLSKVQNAASGVKISWGKVTGATKYRVYYKAGSSKSWKKLADTKKTSYTWTKAKSGTKYTFTVKAYKGSASGAYNEKGKALTYVKAPNVPTVKKVSKGIQISWSKVTGATKYQVLYKIGNGKWKTLVKSTTKRTYTWKAPKNGVKYTFTVKAYKGSTASAYNTKGRSITYKK